MIPFLNKLLYITTQYNSCNNRHTHDRRQVGESKRERERERYLPVMISSVWRPLNDALSGLLSSVDTAGNHGNNIIGHNENKIQINQPHSRVRNIMKSNVMLSYRELSSHFWAC